MSAATEQRSTQAQPVTALVPYLTVHDAAAALDFYAAAFGASEVHRFVGDDGRIGHAEVAIGSVSIYVSDEHPEMGAVAPRSLGGTSAAMVLAVPSVDAVYANALAAGAEGLRPPNDEPHGDRMATVLDPFGHRWNLSQPSVEGLDVDSYNAGDHGFEVRSPTQGGIWAGVVYEDALDAIDLLVEVFGFERRLVVPDETDSSVIVHSQLSWPEGGIVSVTSVGLDHRRYNQRQTGNDSLYVITADPEGVWRRCVDAGLEVVNPIGTASYDEGLVFSVRDRAGNIWSFGSYDGT
ncbi:MAG: hypothetical protein GXP35_01770 [Actinobacteria bacterium]|nr:hypothetical protein [Actinomycetota bacterium]